MGRSTLKKLLLGCTVAVMLVLMIEGLASLVGAFRAAARVQGLREEGHCEYDAELGWRHVKGFHEANFYEPGAAITINSQGFRSADGDFGKEIPEGRYRIVFLGDSFTMGFGVGDEQTFAAQVEALCPTIQSVNMGNGGYGIGQDYLWYLRDGVALDTDLLVFTLIEDDFRRLTLDAFSGYPKPRLRLENDEIVVENSPVPDGWATRTAKFRAAAFLNGLSLGRALLRIAGKAGPPALEIADFDEVATRVFRELKALSESRGQDFALVFLPSSPRLPKSKAPIREWLRETAAAEGVPLIDLSADFAPLTAEQLETFYRPDTHFSVAGNAFVAARLLERLRPLFPALPRD